METTSKLLNAYRADPIRVRMGLERAARRARAEAMAEYGARAAGFIAAAALLTLMGSFAWAA